MIRKLVLLLVFVAVAFGVYVQFIARSGSSNPDNSIKLYTAREIITLDQDSSTAQAIAIKGKTIIAVGSLAEVEQALEGKEYTRVDRFKDNVFTPGFINQHDHPWLAALTLSSQVISIEDWKLPGKNFPRARTPAEYMARLKKLVAHHADPDQIFFSWGHHRLWHGVISRHELDAVSKKIPIIIWQRSAHEFMMNTPALKKLGITKAMVRKFPPGARLQSSFKRGHFWEQGALAIGPVLFKHIVEPARYMAALDMVRDYWRRAGSTLVVEPGGLVKKELQIMQNQVFSHSKNPFHMDYIADGKSVSAQHVDKELIKRTEELMTWGAGMSRFLPKQVKLFSDGAVFSQLMKMKDGYLDGHHGEWIMKPELFKKAFAIYWDAGYQIHVHQNGDAGLDLVLDTLEENLKRNPRDDHRTVIVHFTFSTPEQVHRIARLGAIVSVNPYVPIILGRTYSRVGIGARRAEAMARLGDVARAGISFSLHSDMPMAPGRPLYLMWCAVNRQTLEGGVIGPDQRVSPEEALRAVTIEAAYSLRLEKKLGSLEKGKTANITVLAENPLQVDPVHIKDISVLGTVHEGRLFPYRSVGQIPAPGFWDTFAAYARIIWFKISGN